MDNFGDFGNTLMILIPLIFVVLFNVFKKKRKAEKTQPEIAMSLLSEVAMNQQIARSSLEKSRIKKFRIDSWQRNRGKLDFLSQFLRDELAKAFGMADEFNRAVDATRKFKSSSYLEGISVERLKESFDRSRKGLDDWFEPNKDRQ